MSTPEKESDDKKWHLDRRLPVALLFTILLQTCGVVWWASGQEKDNRFQDQAIAELKARASESDHSRQDTDQRLARVEEKLGSVVDVLRDIRDSIKNPRRDR